VDGVRHDRDSRRQRRQHRPAREHRHRRTGAAAGPDDQCGTSISGTGISSTGDRGFPGPGS
jgi:hypothetical protein